MRFPIIAVIFFVFALAARADSKSIHVFVALCDNASQGIAPVPARIGDGDQPKENLYWGCTEGLASYFKHSQKWELTNSKVKISPEILERLEFKYRDGSMTLVADAYRGADIRTCLADFEKCVASGKYDLVAYIGHNGLMDFDLPQLEPPAKNKTQVIVLCCKSDQYFAERLRRLNARPILLTEQFMYPGAFILHAVLDPWISGASLAEIRAAAGKSYAMNQKISIKAATGVFAKLKEESNLDQATDPE